MAFTILLQEDKKGHDIRENDYCRQRRAKDGQLKSYHMVFNYLLLIYANDYIIAEADAEINSSKQGDRIYPPEYAHDLW